MNRCAHCGDGFRTAFDLYVDERVIAGGQFPANFFGDAYVQLQHSN